MTADLFVQWAGVIVPLIVLVAQGLFVWFLWSLGKKFVAKADCEACHNRLDTQITGVDTRVAGLEGAVEAAPTSKDMQTVMVQLAEISGELKAANARAEGQAELLKSVSRQVSMLNDYHVTKPRRD